MNVRSKMSWLVLGIVLSCSGCYGSVNFGGGVPTTSKDEAAGHLTGTLDTGLIANFEGGQFLVGGSSGFLGLLDENDTEMFLIGGSTELLLEKRRATSSRLGWDLRIAFSIASALPKDSSESGTLSTLFVGPNIKNKAVSGTWLKGGLTPGIAVSYLKLRGETTWSIGVNIRSLAWLDTKKK